ncbi:MAG TPA: hemin uptake protein HemP [Parvibaculum sp.]|jgi:hemin uptake protein HemP
MKGEARLTDAGAGKARQSPSVSSRDLFAGHREVIIEHGEERYRLCITASNKLILIK